MIDVHSASMPKQEIVMNRFVMVAAVLVLAPCATFVTAAHAASRPLVAKTLDSFKQDEARILKNMQQGGKYGYISGPERARVEKSLEIMQKLLTEHANASDLRAEDKVALVNAQEEVNSILTQNDNDRLVCEHKAKMGTKFPVTTCRTYGEMKIEQMEAQRYLDSHSHGQPLTEQNGN
jgi:hypothetical protein